VLRAGMCSIFTGIAVVAAVVVVKSVGTYAPRPGRDGSPAERLRVSVVQKWEPNSPSYLAPVSLQIPDNAGARVTGFDKETVGVGAPFEEPAIFEERYSFREHFASFDERFVGVARLTRRAAVNVVTTEPVLARYATAAETELRGSAADQVAKSAAPTAGPAAAMPSSAAPNSGVRAPRARQASLSSPENQNRTAIYDISAQVVYLPNGRRLEAHSGFGSYMDDPRYVHIKRKGATPPNTYRLVMRENLFHGVQAIRLIPVSGSTMFGRDGILAHHYMLGPNGQSNGCVSLADYPAFLNAFLSGEIDRIVVVERLENPPGQLIAAGWIEKAFKGFIKNLERGSGT
jgi:Tlde1 domain